MWKKSLIIRYSIIISLLLVIGFTIITSNQYQILYGSCDVESFGKTEEDLFNKSEVIIKGSIINVDKEKKESLEFKFNDKTSESKKAELKEKITLPKTVSEVKVDKVIKGNIKPGDVLRVKQYGGIDKVKKTETRISGVDYFTAKSEYVMFLILSPSGEYEEVTPYEGHAKVEKDSVKFSSEHTLYPNKNIPFDELDKKVKNIISSIKN